MVTLPTIREFAAEAARLLFRSALSLPAVERETFETRQRAPEERRDERKAPLFVVPVAAPHWPKEIAAPRLEPGRENSLLQDKEASAREEDQAPQPNVRTAGTIEDRHTPEAIAFEGRITECPPERLPEVSVPALIVPAVPERAESAASAAAASESLPAVAACRSAKRPDPTAAERLLVAETTRRPTQQRVGSLTFTVGEQEEEVRIRVAAINRGLDVSVGSANEELNRQLRGRLGELLWSLEQQGFGYLPLRRRERREPARQK